MRSSNLRGMFHTSKGNLITTMATRDVPFYAFGSLGVNSWSLGAILTTKNPGLITHARLARLSSQAAAIQTVRIWDSVGTLLSTISFPNIGAVTSMQVQPLPSPLSLASGVTFTVAMDASSAAGAIQAATQTVAAFPVSQALTFSDGRADFASGSNFPTASNVGYFGVDVIYVSP